MLSLTNLLKKLRNVNQLEVATPEDQQQVDSRWVGLRDAALSGWFNNEEGLLLEGFDVNKEDILLDIGCGEGGRTMFCAKNGPHIVISDIDTEKVAALKLALDESPARRVEAYVSDSLPLPIADEYVTRIMAMEMLEHVDEPSAVLSEIVRVAKSGAKILLSVPTDTSENFQKGVAPSGYFQSPNHIHIFSEQDIVDLVEKAGLIVERKVKWGFFWTMWMSIHWVTEKNTSKDLTGAALDNVAPPYSEILNDWASTWNKILAMPEGHILKQKLDELLPKSIAIIARKP